MDNDKPDQGAQTEDHDDIFSHGTEEPSGQEGQVDSGQTDGEESGESGQEREAESGQEKEAKLTPEAIAAAFKAAGLGQQTESKQEQPKYTQEDFERAFNVFHVTEDLIEQLGIPEEHKAKAVVALSNLANGVNKQATTMASYMVQQVKEELEKTIAPMRQHLVAQEEQRMKNEFFELNKDLQPYESIVMAVVDQMKQEGYEVKDPKAAYKELASRTKNLLKQTGINLGQGNNQPSSPPGGMPRLPSGGQGGAGVKSASSKTKGPAGMEIFD